MTEAPKRLRTLLFDFRGGAARGPFIVAWLAVALSGQALPILVRLLKPYLPYNLPFLLAVAAATVLLVLFLIWSYVALVVKRLRDSGLPPAAVLIVYAAAAILDHGLATNLTSARFYPPFDGMTPFGGAVHVSLLIVLFLAPSRAPTAAKPANENALLADEEGDPVAVPV
jgi:uncharacterized membrane protein YhaH (DUF805 family)